MSRAKPSGLMDTLARAAENGEGVTLPADQVTQLYAAIKSMAALREDRAEARAAIEALRTGLGTIASALHSRMDDETIIDHVCRVRDDYRELLSEDQAKAIETAIARLGEHYNPVHMRSVRGVDKALSGLGVPYDV